MASGRWVCLHFTNYFLFTFFELIIFICLHFSGVSVQNEITNPRHCLSRSHSHYMGHAFRSSKYLFTNFQLFVYIISTTLFTLFFQALLQYTGHAGSVNSLRFHPSKELVLTASGDGTAHIWQCAVHLTNESSSGRMASSEDELDPLERESSQAFGKKLLYLNFFWWNIC